MHSEWAANMEQTTSMTHETALHTTRTGLYSRGVHWLTRWWWPWRMMWHMLRHSSTTLHETSTQTSSFVKKGQIMWVVQAQQQVRPHKAPMHALQMHGRRLVEVYQGPILEHWESAQAEVLLSVRASKASIHSHSIWGIKTRLTEQMEEGHPARHLIPGWHPTELSCS